MHSDAIEVNVISRALASATRAYLLGILGTEGRTVSDAASSAGVSMATASYHLRRLVGAGLARMERRGRTHVYKWGRDRWFLMCEREDVVGHDVQAGDANQCRARKP